MKILGVYERGVLVNAPVHHEWMPAKSLYFSDPDDHELERCAPIGPNP